MTGMGLVGNGFRYYF